MLKRHFYKLAILLFAVLLWGVSADYVFHKIAYDRGLTREVEIIKKHCQRRGGSKIEISYNGTTAFVEVLGGGCPALSVGQKIKVYYSTYNDGYYWNTAPLARVLWVVWPFCIGIIVYLFILDRRLNQMINSI